MANPAGQLGTFVNNGRTHLSVTPPVMVNGHISIRDQQTIVLPGQTFVAQAAEADVLRTQNKDKFAEK
jgi:hypothetical protein